MSPKLSRVLGAGLITALLSVSGLADSLFGDVSTTQAASIPAQGDEFVGPFASWVNLKTAYGAKGDGVTDDTEALQNALNDVGTGTHSPVLWIPAGTYKITGTLNLIKRIGISVIGEDPATTIIKWGGSNAATNAMLNIDGVAYSRFNRLTFDGSGSQVIAVNQSYNGTGGYFD